MGSQILRRLTGTERCSMSTSHHTAQILSCDGLPLGLIRLILVEEQLPFTTKSRRQNKHVLLSQIFDILYQFPCVVDHLGSSRYLWHQSRVPPFNMDGWRCDCMNLGRSMRIVCSK